MSIISFCAASTMKIKGMSTQEIWALQSSVLVKVPGQQESGCDSLPSDTAFLGFGSIF